MNGPRTNRQETRWSDRGQTTQDFAVGIGLFLLAAAFVFAFVPTVMSPFLGTGGQTAQADRIAATILEDAGGDQQNQVVADDIDGLIDDREADLGLRSTDQLNVTITELGGDTHDEGWDDDRYEGDDASSASRIVTVDGASCDPACRLTVRVW